MFAKLYGTDDDQILVKMDEVDSSPEIRFFFQPNGLGVCSFALSFTHGDPAKAGEMCEEAFAKVTEASARELVRATVEQLGL